MLDQLKVLGWFAKDLHDNEPVMVHGISIALIIQAAYAVLEQFAGICFTEGQQHALTGLLVLLFALYTRSKVTPS